MMDRLVIFFFTVIRNQVRTGRNIHEYTPLPVTYLKKILGEKGTFIHDSAAWLIEGIGEKKRGEFLRVKVSMDKQFEKAVNDKN